MEIGMGIAWARAVDPGIFEGGREKGLAV